MPKFGKRGGESPTRNKKRVTYRGMAPDGKPLVKHSYNLDEAEAFMLVSDGANDDWRACAVRTEPQAWDTPAGVKHAWVPCKRISKT
jgi:hypothetical protein